MDSRRRGRIGCALLFLSAVLLTGCGVDGRYGDWLVSPDETYEKASGDLAGYSLEDKASLYEEDDASVVTMYLTVGQGNEEDGTNHTWTEVNAHPLSYYEELGVAPYKCEAALQVGDEVGPVEGEFGYGATAANAVVQVRGEDSSQHQQKSYRISIKEGMGKWEEQKVIALNKHVTDPLRITNRLAYSLMEEIPGMLSARTRFVHLYVKDKTEGEDGLFRDYGLFTQVEQINKTYLKARGFDGDGQLYKAENFDWQRHEDAILPATSPEFDEGRFEEYLEIKGDEDHSKLISMLEAVNDETQDMDAVVQTWFDEKNLYSWLAFHMLIGNKETSCGKYYLYSPRMVDKWYVISGNNADAFSEIYERMSTPGYSASWDTGIFSWTGSVLFRRIFQNEACRKKFDQAVEEVKGHLTKERIEREAKLLKEAALPYLYCLPDSMHVRVTPEEYEAVEEKLGDEVMQNEKLYQDSLRQPWPFHILAPETDGKKIRFQWEEAYLYPDEQGAQLYYSVEIADSWSFADCIVKEEQTEGTALETDALSPGQYFIRVRAKTSSGYEQDAFEYYLTEQGTAVYSTQCFYVQEDGSIVLSVYDEEE